MREEKRRANEERVTRKKMNVFFQKKKKYSGRDFNKKMVKTTKR